MLTNPPSISPGIDNNILHAPVQLADGVAVNDGILVEQKDVFGAQFEHFFQPAVAATREPLLFFELKRNDGWEFFGEGLQCRKRGAVIDDDDMQCTVIAVEDRTSAYPRHLKVVLRENDGVNERFFLIAGVCFSLSFLFAHEGLTICVSHPKICVTATAQPAGTAHQFS